MTILNIYDVMDKLRCSKSTVYRLIKHQNFPASFKIENLGYRWNAEDVEKWLEQQYRKGA